MSHSLLYLDQYARMRRQQGPLGQNVRAKDLSSVVRLPERERPQDVKSQPV